MIESTLKEGTSTGYLPTREDIGVTGTGKLCQHGIIPTLYYGAKFLPFVANGINWVEQGNHDVISWPFSGCIMAVFTYKGITRVCHVSTGGAHDCKTEWEKIKKESTNVIEFKPADYIDTNGGAWKKNYGIITRNNELYSMTIVGDTNTFKIAKITKAIPL